MASASSEGQAGVFFCDTETTGLDPERHEVWEVGVIVGDHSFRWVLPVDLGRADAVALKVGRYHERRQEPVCIRDDGSLMWEDESDPLGRFAFDFMLLTRGLHMVGAVPSFDDAFLKRLLRANGACPDWHYHLIDVEAMAVGYLYGKGDVTIPLPWKSEGLSRALGVEPDDFDRHTALGDARWAKAMYEAMLV